MSIAKWVLLSIYALSALVTVATIGKERKPGTPKGAASSRVFAGILVWLVVIA